MKVTFKNQEYDVSSTVVEASQKVMKASDDYYKLKATLNGDKDMIELAANMLEDAYYDQFNIIEKEMPRCKYWSDDTMIDFCVAVVAKHSEIQEQQLQLVRRFRHSDRYIN